MARARINRSFACSTWSTVIGSVGGTASSSTISLANALTSHGCPAVNSTARSTAIGVNSCPVSAVCWPYNSATSAAVKSPSRSDLSLMLKGLAVPSRFGSPPLAAL